MKRFFNHRPTVKPSSQAMFTEYGVRDKQTKAKGIVFYANDIKWLSRDKVALEGGYLEAGTGAAHCKHVLILKNARWVVIQKTDCIVA